MDRWTDDRMDEWRERREVAWLAGGRDKGVDG